ncbi:MAG: DNA methyltransferase [Chloroflexota bacterium]
MPALSSELRGLLERTVVQARDAAEAAAAAAMQTLAVERPEAFTGITPEGRRLRNGLRARGRQLGGGSQEQGLPLLIQEVAYAGWHRMLFARFLAENGLLMHPSGVPVTLDECADLAAEEGEADSWMTAAKYAAAMLPGIFRRDDPASQVRFAPEGRQRLELLLATLPPAVFTADDAIGWVYQFWQSRKKKEVNASGRKIGGADLAPVTQLFTEHYMVAFLLENSLGAWWAARHPDSPLLKQFRYLRYKDDGTPAAGTFPGWPERAAEVTVMDPYCGSGHFLVAALTMLRQMRMEEEGLGEAAAADAVLRDNLFGLEIDARCTQLAAFALALGLPEK